MASPSPHRGRCHREPVRWLLAAAVLGSSASAAQAAELGLGLEAGYLDITNARESARAVLGRTPGGFTGGASLRYGLGRRLFLAAGGRYFQRTGERVFAVDATSPVFRLGHPLTLRIIPAYALLGYRFTSRPAPSLLVPYLGLGPGVTFYHEESVIGGLKEGALSQTKASGHAVAGLEYGRRRLRLGLELMYSLVPNSAGVSGISKVYDEKDIGGLTAVGKLTLVP